MDVPADCVTPLSVEVTDHMTRTMIPAELQPYKTELILARRWFEQANAAACRGQLQATAYCCDRGLKVLDRVEAMVTAARGHAAQAEAEA